MTDYLAYRDAYERDGCVRIPGAFVDWVEPLNDAFDRLLAAIDAGGPLPRERAETAADPAIGDIGGSHDPANGTGVLRNAAAHDAAVWAWVTGSPAAEIVGTLTRSSAVQFWYDLWFLKEPSGAPAEGATPWHHDATGHPFVGGAMPSLWIALGEVGIDDAPLLTFAGSHRDPTWFRPPLATGKEHVVPPAGYGEVETMLATVAAAPERIQTWTCDAGDALLIHPMTWHASLPQRRTDRRRLACTSRWLGDDLRYDPGPFAFPGFHTAVDTLAPGARPPVDFLPVIWRAA